MSTTTDVDLSEQKFVTALGALVRAAERDGVDLNRARDLQSTRDDCRWMVEFSRVRDSGR